jgi:hypothetical protein
MTETDGPHPKGAPDVVVGNAGIAISARLEIGLGSSARLH